MRPPRTTLWIITFLSIFYFGIKVVYSTNALFLWSPTGFAEEFQAQEGKLRIAKIFPETNAATSGLQKGDELVSFTGAPYKGRADYIEQVRTAQSTKRLPVTVRRSNGELFSCTIDLVPPFQSGFWSLQFCFYLVLLIIPLLCTVIGLWVCWLRWEDPTARNGGLFFLSAPTFFGMYLNTVPLGARDFYMLYSGLGMTFAGYFCFSFFSQFPAPSALATRWKHLSAGYLVFSILFCPVLLASESLDMYSFRLAHQLYQLTGGGIDLVVGPFLLLGFLGSPLSALPGIRSSQWAADQRRRFGVLWLGILIGCGPLLASLLFHWIWYGEMSLMRFPRWAVLAMISLYALFPLTFGYTVIKHRVLGIKQILRSSVKYAFVSNAYLWIELIALGFIIRYPFSWAADSVFNSLDITPSDLTWKGMYYALIGTGLYGMWRVNPHLQAMIDRAFFRDAYNAQNVLSELSRSVRQLTHTDEVLQRVAAQINTALHVNRIAFMVQGQFLNLPQTAGNSERTLFSFVCRLDVSPLGSIEPNLLLPSTSLVLKKLAESHKPLDVYFDDPDSWTEQLNARSEDSYIACLSEKQILETLDSNLIVPLATKDGMMGFLSLGPKRSEEPYTYEDKQLLMAVAEATALRLENALLIKRVTAEARLKREIEIARHLQQSLLPACDPYIPGADIAGYSTTAYDVGGDYYDFFQLSETRIAIAVGDVTGHGVSSGLLMALAKGGLLNQMTTDPSPKAVMFAMNNLICTTSNTRNLMSFVLATYCAETQTLEMANAGHPHPYHFRAQTQTVTPLERPSYPLGVRKNSQYETITVKLEPGDVVVFFTDGIFEAQNAQGELFGFEGLEQSLAKHAHLAAIEMRNAILDEVRSFLNGRPADDDVTLVVVRVE
ncbi:MAG: SpoIIE family protein phosphatase [Blastocatellia bacterium]|nr:SpoIIE family protein phosphatase [Blastocatellia bacterium]